MVGIRRNQGWKLCSSFAHSLFALLVKITHFKERLWAIRSCRSFKKSNPEQIALIAFYKRATVSKLLLSLFTKERPWAKHSLKKSDVSDSLLVQANPKICPRANCYCCSLLYHSFLKRVTGAIHALYKRVTMSKSLSLLFSKERREQFALFQKGIALLLFCSLAHKKWVIRSKN